MSFTGVRGRGASLPVTECLLCFRVKFRCRVQVHLPPVKLAQERAESDSLCVQALTVFRRCKDYLSSVLNDLFQLFLPPSLSLSSPLCICPKLASLFEALKRHSSDTDSQVGTNVYGGKGILSWLARFTSSTACKSKSKKKKKKEKKEEKKKKKKKKGSTRKRNKLSSRSSLPVTEYTLATLPRAGNWSCYYAQLHLPRIKSRDRTHVRSPISFLEQQVSLMNDYWKKASRGGLRKGNNGSERTYQKKATSIISLSLSLSLSLRTSSYFASSSSTPAAVH